MLTFAAPGYLFAAIAAVAGLAAAHFIVRRQPRALVLPTARFVPDAPVLTAGWARLPADLLLLALRALCVLLAGLALAEPSLRNKAGGTAKVVLADGSRAVADSAEVSDSVAAVRVPGDTVIRYGGEPGSISAALVTAVRAASRFRDSADSVELVIVSAFAMDQVDAATARIRAEWPGRARLVRVRRAAAPPGNREPELNTGDDDPFAVALRMAAPGTRAESRIVRGAMRSSDSAWAGASPGRVLLHWPATTPPAGFVAIAEPERIGGFLAGDHAVLAPFERRWRHVAGLGRPVAWWIDGSVAAAEAQAGESCVRSVAIPVSAAGDFVLRPDFHAAVRALLQPCGAMRAQEAMSPASLALLQGTGPLASAGAFARAERDSSVWTKWLLLAALACALFELLLRAVRSAFGGASAGAARSNAPSRKAA